MKNNLVWKLIKSSLEQKIPVMLLYVLESSGSSPGRQGFAMAVNAKEQMEGSIGGGMMEHKFVELAKEKLRTDNDQQNGTVKKQIHDKSAEKNQSGMICSGEQTIWLYRVSENDLTAASLLIESQEKHQNGALHLSPSGIKYDDAITEKNIVYRFESEDNWSYTEKTGYKNQLFIIGGGHCSLALSNLMRSMDFYIRVFDDRPDLKTMIENTSAHEKHFVKSYSELASLVPAGEHHYVIIMTFGYRSDDLALRTLLHKDFKFIGLLGSKTKIKKMFDDYRSEGIAEARLQIIHTPIGIAINSQTPEEIAVSVAAEVIQVKNKIQF